MPARLWNMLGAISYQREERAFEKTSRSLRWTDESTEMSSEFFEKGKRKD
jgi:hypothetical protein